MSSTSRISQIFAVLALGLFQLAAANAACPTGKTPSAAPDPIWLRLEIYSPLMAEDEPMEWVEVTRSGCVISRYGAATVMPGIFHRDLPVDDLAQLQAAARSERIRHFNAAKVREKLRANDQLRKRNGEPVVALLVSDPGEVRVEIMEENEPTRVLEFEAIEAYADFYRDDPELAEFNQLVQRMRGHGQHPGKSKIAEVRP